MAQFPTLKTGAVAQYPIRTTYTYRADVVLFLDGSEQRLRNSPSVIHTWDLVLSQLDEQEMSAIEQFFLANQGRAGAFSFTDPWSGIVYPNCSLASDELSLGYLKPLSGLTAIRIRENRS